MRGKSFVNNHTKGKKKGFNFRWYVLLENKIKQEGISEDVIKQAKRHLDFCKRLDSERTYYRHKKKVR